MSANRSSARKPSSSGGRLLSIILTLGIFLLTLWLNRPDAVTEPVSTTPGLTSGVRITDTVGGGTSASSRSSPTSTSPAVLRGEAYSSPEEVGLYIHLYEELPPNYLTKREAESRGWDAQAGNLWEVAPGMSIGGDYFGNREELLPEARGRSYYECDVNYNGGWRGAERIVYSNDGLVFYTDDHYASYEQFY